ncbi:hypothetical protein HGM15179_013125 [Zosterops borbonicus]|uniref:Uncharacterized protein n=1 Tax=Zosterops borbonicus TaxID=364589 RepID=A0A8K1G9H1_9PASS|nr:hypothetical protein HGM15179_013125 [Zosterops borbonicus]
MDLAPDDPLQSSVFEYSLHDTGQMKAGNGVELAKLRPDFSILQCCCLEKKTNPHLATTPLQVVIESDKMMMDFAFLALTLTPLEAKQMGISSKVEMTGPWDDQALLFSCHATLTLLLPEDEFAGCTWEA